MEADSSNSRGVVKISAHGGNNQRGGEADESRRDGSRGGRRGVQSKQNEGSEDDEREEERGAEDQSVQRPGERGNPRGTERGVCLHCEKATGPDGKGMKLYRCSCGNEFHHLCAGKRGHDDMTVCFECAN